MDIGYLIDHHFEVISYKKGAVIYEPGAMPRAVYFIKSGEVKMATVNSEGKEFIQGIFKTAEYFGEPALLVGRPYLAYTVATCDTEIIPVLKKEFIRLLETQKEFSMALIRNLSNRLFYKSMMLEELANEQSEHRVRTLVNYLFKDQESGAILKFTRQQLADMSGLRVETVIKLVKKLAAQQELKLSGSKIVKL